MPRLIFLVSMSVLSALLLTGCPPDPNAPPAPPTVGWTIRDVTTAASIPVYQPSPGQFAATVVGQHQLSVNFNAQSASGVGSMNTDGTIANVQCGFTTVAQGGHPPGGPIVEVHPSGDTISKQLDAGQFNATSSTVQTSSSLEYDFNVPMPGSPNFPPQICPKNYRAGPGVTISGVITLAGRAMNWRNPGLQADSILSITLTSGVAH